MLPRVTEHPQMQHPQIQHKIHKSYPRHQRNRSGSGSPPRNEPILAPYPSIHGSAQRPPRMPNVNTPSNYLSVPSLQKPDFSLQAHETLLRQAAMRAALHNGVRQAKPVVVSHFFPPPIFLSSSLLCFSIATKSFSSHSSVHTQTNMFDNRSDQSDIRCLLGDPEKNCKSLASEHPSQGKGLTLCVRLPLDPQCRDKLAGRLATERRLTYVSSTSTTGLSPTRTLPTSLVWRERKSSRALRCKHTGPHANATLIAL